MNRVLPFPKVGELMVHPLADLFPMLPDPELSELADDIKANGQRFPILFAVIEGKKILLDGRNRLAACTLAEVEPWFEQLPEDADPVACIFSANAARRQMTKGALAMVVAKFYPEPEEKKGRGKKSSATEHFPMVTRPKLSEARLVMQFAAELADRIIAGASSLDDAYELAQKRKGAADSDRQQMAHLHKAAPDLAQLVQENRLKLSEAIASLKDREQEARAKLAEQQRTAVDLVMRAVAVAAFANDEMLEFVLSDKEIAKQLRLRISGLDEQIADLDAGLAGLRKVLSHVS